MFNPEEDEEKLREAVKFIIKEYKIKKLESIGRILYVFKIWCSYLFAFVGFIFLFLLFFFHKNIMCYEQNANINFSQKSSSLIPLTISNNISLQTCLDNYDLITIEYNKCSSQLENYSDTCDEYCVKQVFKPICNKYSMGLSE